MGWLRALQVLGQQAGRATAGGGLLCPAAGSLLQGGHLTAHCGPAYAPWSYLSALGAHCGRGAAFEIRGSRGMSSGRHIPAALGSLAPAPGSRSSPKRVGRGPGSKYGKTSGMGHKGHKARAGSYLPYPLFEGGAKPLARKLPKRGIAVPKRFRKEYTLLPLQRVVNFVKMGRLDPSKDLDHHELLTSRAAGHTIAKSGIYLIQDGPLFTPLDVALRLRVAKADSHVVATVEAAGGSVAEVPFAKPRFMREHRVVRMEQRGARGTG